MPEDQGTRTHGSLSAADAPLEVVLVNREPESRSRLAMESAGAHLGWDPDTIAELVSPQEVRLLRLPCRILGKVIVFWGVVALHNNARGPFKGGIRLAADVSLWETVELSRLMTLKTAVVNIEFGGGKTGIRVDMPAMYRKFDRTPIDLDFEKIISLDAVELYAQIMRETFASHYYVPAPDMGTGPDEMAAIINATQDPASVTGKPEGIIGWQPGRRESTGYGVSFVATRYVQEVLDLRPNRCTAAVQGFGNAGGYAARFLAEQGVRIVAITDLYGGVYHQKGLDVEALIAYAAEQGTVRGYPGADTLTNEQLFGLDVDILVPAAAGNAITDTLAHTVRAKVVVEGANMPTTPPAMRILADKNIAVIPDIVANAGGVVASMEEYARSLSAAKTPSEQVFGTIRELLGDAMDATLERSHDMKVSLYEAAVSLAMERVYDAMKRRRMI